MFERKVLLARHRILDLFHFGKLVMYEVHPLSLIYLFFLVVVVVVVAVVVCAVVVVVVSTFYQA
jgi:hypothetical protein